MYTSDLLVANILDTDSYQLNLPSLGLGRLWDRVREFWRLWLLFGLVSCPTQTFHSFPGCLFARQNQIVSAHSKEASIQLGTASRASTHSMIIAVAVGRRLDYLDQTRTAE